MFFSYLCPRKVRAIMLDKRNLEQILSDQQEELEIRRGETGWVSWAPHYRRTPNLCKEPGKQYPTKRYWTAFQNYLSSHLRAVGSSSAQCGSGHRIFFGTISHIGGKIGTYHQKLYRIFEAGLSADGASEVFCQEQDEDNSREGVSNRCFFDGSAR